MGDIPYAALAGLGGNLLSGGIGELLAGMDEREQEALLRQAVDAYGNIDLPKLERLSAEQLGPSRFDSIQTDPALRQAQMDALDSLQREARAGGMTLDDRATYLQAGDKAARDASGAMGRIREGLEARGMGGSGTETALQFGAAQGQAQRAGEAALQTAADSRRRALDSMMAGGRLAGSMREQEFGEKSRGAEAADAIARYNAESRARANQYNAGLGQQGFENQRSLLGGKVNALNGQSALAGQRAQGKRQFWAGMGEAGRQAGREVQRRYDLSDPAQSGSRGYGSLPGDWTQYEQSTPDDWDNPWKKGGF
jgi:hypothetical protein